MIGYVLIKKEKTENGISAINCKDIAESEGKKWDSNAFLFRVDSIDPMNNGEAKHWEFSYINTSKLTYIFTVTIASDLSYTTHLLTNSANVSEIFNWTIDSTRAVEIAKSYPEIENYISTYSNAKISSISLTGYNPHTYNCSWRIEWNLDNFFDPVGIGIKIDGHTGEVMHVE
jgi:hypothetical protein